MGCGCCLAGAEQLDLVSSRLSSIGTEWLVQCRMWGMQVCAHLLYYMFMDGLGSWTNAVGDNCCYNCSLVDHGCAVVPACSTHTIL